MKILSFILSFLVSIANVYSLNVTIDGDTVGRIRKTKSQKTYAVRWSTDTDFDKGTHNITEVSGTGESASVTLQEVADNSDDVIYTTPSNYTYNNGKIEVADGVAKLLSSGFSDDNNWTFTTPANYTYDTNKIQITGTVAKLTGDPPSVYAQYHLNETSGTTVSDASGNGRDGTTINMDNSNWVTGKLNNCLVFDGAGEHVDLGSIASFERTDPFSVEAWIKLTDTGYNTIISKQDGVIPFTGWLFIIWNDGYLHFLLTNNSSVGNYLEVKGSTIVRDGVWHHVVAAYDGSSNASGVSLYVDGVSETETVIRDTLSASIITTINCKIGARDSQSVTYYNGNIDEVAIYDQEISSSYVVERYNSGTGIEDIPGAFPTDDPDIINATGYSFTSAINDFTETITTPTNTNIKYQLSSDNGTTWKYWNGSSWTNITDSQTNSWYYTNESNTGSTVNSNITALATTGTLKFKAFLHTTDDEATPELDNLYITIGATYPTDNPVIEMNYDIQPAHNNAYLSTVETVNKPTNTDIKYQYSINNGSSYNGSWLTEPQLETALQGLNPVGDGSDVIRFKAQLATTDSAVTPKLDNLNIVSDAGYSTSGTYTSNIYNSNYRLAWWSNITFNTTDVAGGTTIFKVRTSENGTDWGNWSDSYNNNDTIKERGSYIQWKCNITGNSVTSPSIDDVSIYYKEPDDEIRSP